MVLNISTMEKVMSQIIRKLSYNTWNIGIIERRIEDVLFKSNIDYEVHWVKHDYRDRFFADPFIYSVDEDVIKILVEEFLYNEKVGRISMLTVKRYTYELIGNETLLKKPYHLSYPFVFLDNVGGIFILPEASMSGVLTAYKMDELGCRLISHKVIVPEPLCDSTIIYYQNRYWLFGTKRGKDSNSKLYIYHSQNAEGPYIPHKNNPVLFDPSIARPAGSMFVADDGDLYRLTQKNDNYYGEGVNLTKVDFLSDDKFGETLIKRLPSHVGRYKDGFHTLNGKRDICVVDGFCKEFSPVRKMIYELSSRIKKNKYSFDE